MKNKLNKKTIAILVIAIVIIILITLVIVLSSKSKPNEEKIQEEYKQTIQDNAVSKLSKMTEMERIQEYLSNFVEKIENKNWSAAYEDLYLEFKENYFKTEKEFKEYCEEYFPSIFSIKNDNIERINNIYVLESTVTDLVNYGEDFGIYFVIRENALNDYDLSFSVNSAMDLKNN